MFRGGAGAILNRGHSIQHRPDLLRGQSAKSFEKPKRQHLPQNLAHLRGERPILHGAPHGDFREKMHQRVGATEVAPTVPAEPSKSSR